MNKVKFTLLAASLALALALTFSCSSDGDDGGGNVRLFYTSLTMAYFKRGNLLKTEF